jgi:Tol biopolymer transport system component
MTFSFQIHGQVVFPISEGKIVFHRYTDFSNYDGQLYILDFGTREFFNLTTAWDIDNTTNAHFSPDGTKLVFMGVPRGQHTRSSWDIYLWTVGSSTPPENLTQGNGVLDQDPKFFPDGQHVAFKHDGDVAIIDLSTRAMTTLTSGGSISEKSMEYPSADGKKILFAEGDGAQSAIYSIDVTTKVIAPLITEPVQNYYPIVRDDTTFLYARWASTTNAADEIYVSNYAGQSAPAAFNTASADDSDPYPVDSVLVLFSSDRAGGKGGYDLYVGNLSTGATRSLNLFGVNTQLQELGVCYTRNSAPLSVRQGIGQLPRSILLRQNYPNPFNPETTIEYALERADFVKLALYDILGREVAVLVNEFQWPGEHRCALDTTRMRLVSGVYLYRLSAGSEVCARVMVLME